LVRFRCAQVKAKDRLRAWVEHLVLNCVGAGEYPRESILIGSDATLGFGAIEECREILEALVARYWEGLCHPVHFFPAASFEYATKVANPVTAERALDAARSKWEGNDFVPGEAADPYYRLCFKNVDPLDEIFAALALEVFEPLLADEVTL
jgi:exodeoxyribonuclease V gamma subunit